LPSSGSVSVTRSSSAHSLRCCISWTSFFAHALLEQAGPSLRFRVPAVEDLGQPVRVRSAGRSQGPPGRRVHPRPVRQQEVDLWRRESRRVPGTYGPGRCPGRWCTAGRHTDFGPVDPFEVTRQGTYLPWNGAFSKLTGPTGSPLRPAGLPREPPRSVTQTTNVRNDRVGQSRCGAPCCMVTQQRTSGSAMC
jgi:hypothetical protein